MYSLEPPRRGGSNEYPQFMFSSKIKKNKVYPCTPQFYYIKLGFKGGQNYKGEQNNNNNNNKKKKNKTKKKKKNKKKRSLGFIQ